MANYYGTPAPYPQQFYGTAVPAPFTPKVRRPSRFNLAAICLSLFAPWMLFCSMYWVMSFSTHYKETHMCYFIVILGLVFVLATTKMAFESVMKERIDTARADPSWFVFLALACFIAWLGGVALGDLNYFYNMEPYYELKNMNSYDSVDPSKMPGQQVMDAGRLSFVDSSRLDLHKAMAFRNVDVYCVAPIVSSNQTGASYDFWAVGLNCCSGRPGDFACGEYNNRHATSGLRVMHKTHRDFYQLAVQQAQASYGIIVKHPLFLYWMQDPLAEMAAYQDEGYKYFLYGVFSFFGLMLFLIIVAMVVFTKMGH